MTAIGLLKETDVVIFVDIDETICEHSGTDPHSVRDYSKAVPIENNIIKINKLYDEGNTIVYWTARGATTGINWVELTEKQLNDWGAKFDELKCDKPFFDLFIDDKVMNTKDFF